LAIVTTSVLALPAAAPLWLGVVGRANANVSLAADGRFVTAVWSGSTREGADIYAAVSRDAGITFSLPVRVNSAPGGARVNGEQPPRVSLVARTSGDPTIVVVWTAKGSTGTALMTARSLDGGRSFGRDGIVRGTDAAGNRGWEAIATDKNGRVSAVWLDHRDTAPSGSSGGMAQHAEHHTSASAQIDRVAQAQLSKLYFGILGGSTPPRAVTGGVCYCCKTSLAAGPDGALYAAWRHVYPGNVRDIAFTVSRDGGQTFAAPVRVSEDKWAIDGCPENGPSLAVDAERRVHVVWPTLVPGARGGADTLGMFHAMSHDGRQFTLRQTVPTEGVPRHVHVAAAPDGSIVLVWDEAIAGGRRVVFARGSIEASGRVRFRRQTLTALGPASYPAVAVAAEGAVVAASAGGATDSTIRFTHVPFEW
jgi:hypothetical protein